MLRQVGFQMWAEKQREQDEYAEVSTKGFKFEKLVQNSILDAVLKLNEFTIAPLYRDTFGYKFEVFDAGRSQEKFYTEANAKRFVVKMIQEQLEVANW